MIPQVFLWIQQQLPLYFVRIPWLRYSLLLYLYCDYCYDTRQDCTRWINKTTTISRFWSSTKPRWLSSSGRSDHGQQREIEMPSCVCIVLRVFLLWWVKCSSGRVFLPESKLRICTFSSTVQRGSSEALSEAHFFGFSVRNSHGLTQQTVPRPLEPTILYRRKNTQNSLAERTVQATHTC